MVEYPISGGDFLAAGHVTKKIKQRLENLGVHHKTVTRAAIAAYEAELNVIIHARCGKLQLKLGPNSVLIIVEDDGPGILDIDLAMQEGYSTAPPAVREMGYGAGMGLPNINRCADSLIMQSEVGVGTRLEILLRY
ncbi:MAG: anti-sigma regulatory factor [Clostridium sp.]|nr:anti-sigma regulatory factor [Clostridium sp.]